MSFYSQAKQMLSFEEGVKARVYQDTKGIPTIGIGHNLKDNAISEKVIEQIFCDDFAHCLVEAQLLFYGVWPNLDQVRQLAIVNLIFCMGSATFQTFKKTVAAIKAEDWDTASQEVLDSKFAIEVPPRAARIAEMLELGEWPADYA